MKNVKLVMMGKKGKVMELYILTACSYNFIRWVAFLHLGKPQGMETKKNAGSATVRKLDDCLEDDLKCLDFEDGNNLWGVAVLGFKKNGLGMS